MINDVIMTSSLSRPEAEEMTSCGSLSYSSSYRMEKRRTNLSMILITQ